MKRIVPPIKYYGGKGNMIKEIVKYIPNNDKLTTYIEPFGGSYSVGLSLTHFTNEIYNDLEQNVYSLYKVLSDTDLYKAFKYKCDLAIYSEDLRKEYKDKLKYDELDIIDRAFYFFYVNRTSYNGIGAFSYNDYVRRKMSKSASDFLSAIDRLPELHQRLSKVVIFNRDGLSLLEQYDKENIFFYLDPPYVQNTRSSARYVVDMDDSIQNQLIDKILNLKHAKFLLSGYENDLYDEKLKHFNKVSFNVKTVDGHRNKKNKIETLWFNY